MQAKMPGAACILDAKPYQGPSRTVIRQLARQLLVFFENHRIRWMVVLGWPGGMRRGAGGDYEGVLRSARCDLQFRTCALDLTRQLLPNGKGGGFNRSAHSAGPGRGKREFKIINDLKINRIFIPTS